MSLCNNYNLDPFSEIVCNNISSCPLTANHLYNLWNNIPKNIIYITLGYYIIPVFIFVFVLLSSLILTNNISFYTAFALFFIFILCYIIMTVIIILLFKNLVTKIPQIVLKTFQETEPANKFKCFSNQN